MKYKHQRHKSHNWRRRYNDEAWKAHADRRGGRIFFSFFLVFGLIALLFFGGVGAIILLATRLFDGTGEVAALAWVVSCGLALALPILAMGISRIAFQRIAAPLANVMTAADAVAEGDLSARVPERGPGEFRRLAQSFNRMTEELSRADQQRRNLTADVAHELRTPLHIIQGNLEGILDGVYEGTPEHITATLEETRLLARLVQDLQTLSQAEAGQLTLRLRPVNVSELLADIETSFSGQAEANNVTLQVQSAPNLSLFADSDRLNQVLSNLMANALRHTPAGGHISLQATSSGEGVKISLADSGEGIPAEDLAYIFDRFWRGNRARTHADGVGGGLGLAIARQLIQLHGGTITVESTPGEGTSFSILLPPKPPSSQQKNNVAA